MVIVFLVMLCQIMHPIMRQRITSYDMGTFVWGVVCQQGSDLKISNASGRVVVFTTFLAFLALFTSYSANIVGLLESPSDLIKTVDDLIESPLMLSIQETTYNRDFYLESNNSEIRHVYETKVVPQGVTGWINDPFEGVERLRTELLAFQVETKVAYKAIAKTFTESEKCSLSELQFIQLPMITTSVDIICHFVTIAFGLMLISILGGAK